MADENASGSRTTGNVPVSDISSGGTKGAPSTGKTAKREPVESGDRNEMGKEPEKGPAEGGGES